MMRKKRRSSTSVDKGQSAPPPDVSKSKKTRTSGRTQSKSAPVQEDPSYDSVFGQFVREAGIVLRQGSTFNEIVVDQVVFQKKLQLRLRKSPRYPGIVQEFITGLESHIEDPESFRNCLLPCVPRVSDGDPRSIQESLLRMLLGIEMLQTLIMNTLFEKLPEFMFDGAAEDGLNIPHVIVNQFKLLDRVMDSKDLAGKLMQLVSVAPVEIQRDIITSLPEILEDSQHGDIARELNSLLQQDTQLTVPILDALPSLNLSSSLLTEVRRAVMATLSAVQLEDLPVVVKFILHSISASDAYEVVRDLRKKLELCVLEPVLQASQSRRMDKGTTGSSTSTAASSVALVLDVIKSAVRFQKTISEAWLKVIESVDTPEDHKVLDLLVLFILHDASNANHSRRGAERLLRVKVKGGQVLEALLQKTFRGYPQVMRGYFPSILTLAQSLLRSPDPCHVPFGVHMYRHSFTAFDSYCQQEVVGSLVTHVCSGVGGEVDVALELLCGLVKDKPSEMALYAVFVKGILDYMDNLSPQQIRRLFYLLSALASAHIQDDMHILIRKQLRSTVAKYKRIGIIGAVMVVGSMGAARKVVKDSQGSTLPKDTYEQVTALLELVRSCSESSPEAAALYYDELANLVLTSTLDPRVQTCIGESVLEDFQKDFVVDLGPDITGSFPFPACVMYNLDKDESQEGIAINLLPLLSADLHHKGELWSHTESKAEKRVSPVCLSPFFRLLRLCEAQQYREQYGEDLGGIDALLGCPLIMTDMEVVEKAESLSKPEREILCNLLFSAINWFREVVNAFCTQLDTEMKMKVMTRLQNITYLQTLLERILAVTPGYSPPLANFDGESICEGPAVPSSTAAAKKPRKEGTGKKRKAPGKSSSEDSSVVEEGPEAEESQQEQPEKEKGKEKGKEKEKEAMAGVSLGPYRPFFRELDMEVLSVLDITPQDITPQEEEVQKEVKKEVKLGPAELVFLLEDMRRKLQFSLQTTKRAPFSKGKTDRSVGFSHLQQKTPKDITARCVQLLPTLCTHLENCHNHFQVLQSENLGVVDAPGVDVREYQLLSSAYQLLLQVLHLIFSWSGFSQPEQSDVMKGALGVLAGRLKEGETETTQLDLLVKHSFEYLLNFRSTVPSLPTALCLAQLLITLSGRGGDHAAYKDQTASLARHFLCQEWVTANGEREAGVKHNETLQTILNMYLEHTDDVLKAVEEIAGEGVPELLNGAKGGCSGTWPTLNRQTFLVFYKGMMGELEKAVRKIPPSRPNDNTEVQSEKLLIWNLAVRDFHILVNLVKVFDSRPVLIVCLKYGRLFLESFMKLGMPLLDLSFKKHKEDVQSLLRTLQLSTRQLHHMCGHSKIKQDTALTNHVPGLKKSLEQFVYRVKAMLTLNHCQDAFWLGNLKNRDLKGEEILSQQPQGSDEEEEGSQLPQEQEEEAHESESEGRRNDTREEEEEDDSDD